MRTAPRSSLSRPAAATDGRAENKVDTQVVVVKQGAEPQLFKSHFLDWDENFFKNAKFEDIYAKRKSELLQKVGNHSSK